ncbi:MAG: FtsX-like permease family protein [Ignavibacterium album]|uniref:ABC transporter permease n=1 Tax=Ignavibacterium album TaxID=591197 RepID=UPI0026ED572B|nr:FtsX-like permease family protein [Ignavibacterium album]MCX8105895.1 FtsX-like permease family protein [Ignavibacterium album]
MKLYLVLAWRNIWRNKRRTLLAASSIFFAIVLAIFTRAIQHGTYDYMIDSAVRMFTGYLQVHGKDYWEERSLEKAINYNPELLKRIEKVNYVELAVPRLENFLLISSKEITKVTSIIAIEPEKENRMTKLEQKLINGRFLNDNDEGILISEGLAKMLNVNVGDSVVLYGQGIYGITAAANYPIIGIVKFALPDLNNSLTYIPLKFGQSLFSMENQITTISIIINNPKKLNYVLTEVKKIIGADYNVMTWQEMMPELVQGIQLDSVSGLIMLFILYLVIAFGIFGTVMMMTAERTKEFGILISVGVKKSRLIIITTLEAIFISLIGAVSGIVISIPMIIYFHNNPVRFSGELAEISLKFGVEPIIPVSNDFGIIIAQTSVVLLIALLSSLYAVNYIRKLKPIEAIRI